MKTLPLNKVASKKQKTTPQNKKKIRIWTLSNKLLGMCLLPMIVVCGSITMLSSATIRSTIDEEVLSSLQIVSASVVETYTNLYEGDYSVDFVGKVRKGKTEINGNYQLIDALKEKTESFLEMAQNTTESADIVRNAVEEITEGARNQADSTGSAHDNIIMMGNQISLITQEVDSMADSAVDMSKKEKESEMIIADLSASSDHTKESVVKVEQQIGYMNKAVEDIKQAVEMIQNIADETDLLSLNASIEATRAGDAGRGFAVVAEQICKLALQSNESGKEIDRILVVLKNKLMS